LNNLLIQITGAAVLIAAIGWGYWAWVRPHNVSAEAKALLALIIMTAAGGLIGSTGWWTDNPNAFSWDLPPLASRMLGAAGMSFGVVAVMALRRPTHTRLQLILLMLFVYLVPLAVAIVLFHLDRFDPNAPITYAFFTVVGMMVLPTMWFLWRRPAVLPDEAKDTAPPHPLVSIWLICVGIVTALWGLVLFITDNGPVAGVWVWPGDLLTSRLIAVMLLTVAAACFYSKRYDSAARMTLAIMIVYGFGAVIAGLINLTVGRPEPALYVRALGAIAIVSAVLLFRRELLKKEG
jgi:hypothetical protein